MSFSAFLPDTRNNFGYKLLFLFFFGFKINAIMTDKSHLNNILTMFYKSIIHILKCDNINFIYIYNRSVHLCVPRSPTYILKKT